MLVVAYLEDRPDLEKGIEFLREHLAWLEESGLPAPAEEAGDAVRLLLRSSRRMSRRLGDDGDFHSLMEGAGVHTSRDQPSVGSCRGRSKRAKRGQRQAELLAMIAKMSGASASELANAIGIKSTQVHALIREAEAEGRIKKKGQGYALKA